MRSDSNIKKNKEKWVCHQGFTLSIGLRLILTHGNKVHW